jgi:acetate kinase
VPEPGIALCLNAGSSSLKFALFRVDAASEQPLATGSVERIGGPDARAILQVGSETLERACPNAQAAQAFEVAFQLLEQCGLPRASVVGHRVVHGGQDHVGPARIDAELLAELKNLVPLAPLHMPASILGIERALSRLPDVPQVACFDTSFHARLPAYAARFPLPDSLYDQGIRRYGFHGLSYESILSTLGRDAPSRIIVAHLGNGASLAAIQDGRSVDTSMGFTPGGGIMMGTRAGDLDPGLLCYLLREKGYSAESLEALVDKGSGLLAVGGSADVRALTERREQDAKADLALTMLGYAVRKMIGAYFAVLGGLDLLVFTGGIGQHSAAIRNEACRGLGGLGISLDPVKNGANESLISSPGTCPVRIVESDEDRMIARQARALLGS